MPAKALCIECRERPRYKTYHRCSWCWVAREPIELQEAWAAYRLSQAPTPHRARVAEKDWKPGHRWCAGCQWMVPLSYTRGSRCIACESRARHRAEIQRTYGITGEEYEALLTWQGGRCFICGQMPRATRLAVDHNHVTGKVRGLLCAGKEEGCNWNLRKILGDPDAAYRAYAYAELAPLERMRLGMDHPLPTQATRAERRVV